MKDQSNQECSGAITCCMNGPRLAICSTRPIDFMRILSAFCSALVASLPLLLWVFSAIQACFQDFTFSGYNPLAPQYSLNSISVNASVLATKANFSSADHLSAIIGFGNRYLLV